MKILFTGFEPFGDVLVNSSQQTLNELMIDNAFKLLLPVTINDSFKILDDFLANNKIDLIIMLGMAQTRNMISLENQAINLLDFRIPDNNGTIINNQKIKENGIDILKSSLNISEIVDYLNASGYQTYMSLDAGKYICNYLYYMTLYKYPQIPSVFIHIPLLNDQLNVCKVVNLLSELINFRTK